MRKRVLLLGISLILVLNLCACGGLPKRDMSNKFLNYYGNELGEHNGIRLPSGQYQYLYSLRASSSDAVKKTVVMMVTPNTAKGTYDWISLSNEQRKADMKNLGRMFHEYAEHMKYGDGYDLYVVSAPLYGSCCVIYNYGTGQLWIPDLEDTYKEIYEKYQTFELSDIEKVEGGTQYLLDKGLVKKTKNGIQENDNGSYYIQINGNGTLESGDMDRSTEY